MVFDTLASTNRWALENISRCSHGDVVHALRQTEGRGRFDRSWLAPDDRGLALSVVLKPDRPLKPVTPTLCAALAICRCLEEFNIAALLKWPNDTMVEDRKIAGILASADAENTATVLGVGLNVNVTRADLGKAHLENTATSMVITARTTFSIETVLSHFLKHLERLLAIAAKNPESLNHLWATRDWLAGHDVEITCADRTVTGRYMGVDKDGRLQLRDDSGNELLFWSGDIKRL